MQERVEQELALLRTRYLDLEYQAQGQWVHLPTYPVNTGWNRTITAVAFQIPVAFPGTPPYAFYVPASILCGGTKPINYVEPAPNQPPFPGSWGVFSWAHTEEWRATADVRTGSNLLNWALGFSQRFEEGV